MTTDISTGWMVAFVVAAIWEIVWKGIALWRASKRDQRGWFVALLIVNSVGILPIIYLLINKNKNEKFRASV